MLLVVIYEKDLFCLGAQAVAYIFTEIKHPRYGLRWALLNSKVLSGVAVEDSCNGSKLNGKLHSGKGNIERILQTMIVGECDKWVLYLQIIAIRAQHNRIIIHNLTKEINTVILCTLNNPNHSHPNTIILPIKTQIPHPDNHHKPSKASPRRNIIKVYNLEDIRVIAGDFLIFDEDGVDGDGEDAAKGEILVGLVEGLNGSTEVVEVVEGGTVVESIICYVFCHLNV